MSTIPDESTRDKVEVMTAYLMKKPIEAMLHDDQITGENTVWYEVATEPEWNWEMATWRIKT